MRSAVKHALCSTLFVLILAILLLAVSWVFQPKGNAARDGILDQSANGILGEAEQTIDVLIVGDSETYSSFIPLKIWQDCGITSYVCATPAQKLYYSSEFLQKAFAQQTPKLVILETNAVFRNFTYADVVFHNLEQTFSVFRYHNRWKSLQPKDFTLYVNNTNTDSSKGYSYNTAVSAADTKGYMKPTKKQQRISAKNQRYIEEMQAFCEENGAAFLLVSTPSTKNWNYARHNSIAALAQQMGIPYIDMNLLQKEIPIDWKTDTRDGGDHLNHAGAVKVTDYLTQYLQQTGAFTDKRGDTRYADWEEALAAFNRATADSLKP